VRNKFAYDAINDVIKAGLDLIRESQNNVRDSQFDIWLDYSTKMLDRLSRFTDPSIQINYLRLLLSLQVDRNMNASQKLTSCLEYLMKALQAV